jgi:hypothetical protein
VGPGGLSIRAKSDTANAFTHAVGGDHGVGSRRVRPSGAVPACRRIPAFLEAAGKAAAVVSIAVADRRAARRDSSADSIVITSVPTRR